MMDQDQQRDYAEEAYNRQTMENPEGDGELGVEQDEEPDWENLDDRPTTFELQVVDGVLVMRVIKVPLRQDQEPEVEGVYQFGEGEMIEITVEIVQEVRINGID